MKDIMIDLETLSTRPDAAILEIGAVYFDEEKIGEEFFERVNINRSYIDGRVDGETLHWYLKRRSYIEERKVYIEEGLSLLQNFFLRSNFTKDIRVWGNGASFDLPILKECFIRHNAIIPWVYSNERCYRTMASIYEPPYTPRPHTACEDAKMQALDIIWICKNYNIKLK